MQFSRRQLVLYLIPLQLSLDSVLAEYRLGLENGELDPEEYLPKFIQALREAGIEKVIAEKQRQLDSWVAEK